MTETSETKSISEMSHLMLQTWITLKGSDIFQQPLLERS
jgi:hypothetical protein